jgi:O-antigen ligase
MEPPAKPPATASTGCAASTTTLHLARLVIVLTALLAVLGVAATYRQGAFYSPASATVAIVAAALTLARLLAVPQPRPQPGPDPQPRYNPQTTRALYVLAATTILAAWWMASAAIHHEPGAFLPLGAGMVAFGCAFVMTRGLPSAARPLAASMLLSLGAVSGLVGLVAVLLRWTPLAISSQDLWRLAGTLTYSNAAGALLALSLLIGLSLSPDQAWVRLALFLCTCSLVATQSRGAVLAAAIALCLIPWATLKETGRTLGLGVVAGLFTVALSAGNAGHPVGLVVLAALAVVAGTLRPAAPSGRARPNVRTALGAAVIAVVALVAALTVLHTPIARRLQLASSLERGTEWTAAVRAWRSSPIIGVGPDKPLHVVAADGNVAHFAHNEYLQVLAGGGVIGEVLLLGLAVMVVRAIGGNDLMARCGCAALLAFALTGALDFDWHLPALCLWAGWAGGLAATPPACGTALPQSERSQSHR